MRKYTVFLTLCKDYYRLLKLKHFHNRCPLYFGTIAMRTPMSGVECQEFQQCFPYAILRRISVGSRVWHGRRSALSTRVVSTPVAPEGTFSAPWRQETVAPAVRLL